MLLRGMFHDLFGALSTSKLLWGEVEGNVAWPGCFKFRAKPWAAAILRWSPSHHSGSVTLNFPWALGVQPRN